MKEQDIIRENIARAWNRISWWRKALEYRHSYIVEKFMTIMLHRSEQQKIKLIKELKSNQLATWLNEFNNKR